MKQPNNNSMPTPQQVALLYLNKGGFCIEEGAAMKRHFGMEGKRNKEEWWMNKPEHMPVRSARKVGKNIRITTDDATFEVPFVLGRCDRARIELFEEYNRPHRQPLKDEADVMGVVYVKEQRLALVIEYGARAKAEKLRKRAAEKKVRS